MMFVAHNVSGLISCFILTLVIQDPFFHYRCNLTQFISASHSVVNTAHLSCCFLIWVLKIANSKYHEYTASLMTEIAVYWPTRQEVICFIELNYFLVILSSVCPADVHYLNIWSSLPQSLLALLDQSINQSKSIHSSTHPSTMPNKHPHTQAPSIHPFIH